MTRGLIAKVAQTDWQLKIFRKAHATFKRMSPRDISPPKAVGEVTGFCVTREAPGRFGRKVSIGFGPDRKYFSSNVFRGLVEIRDKLSLKIRDKGDGFRVCATPTDFWYNILANFKEMQK